MASNERELMEREIRSVSQQAAAAGALIDEAKETGLSGSPVVVRAKTLREELLQVKTHLERELQSRGLNCSACGKAVHYIAGIGDSPGHWAHREPGSLHDPVL